MCYVYGRRESRGVGEAGGGGGVAGAAAPQWRRQRGEGGGQEGQHPSAKQKKIGIQIFFFVLVKSSNKRPGR